MRSSTCPQPIKTAPFSPLHLDTRPLSRPTTCCPRPRHSAIRTDKLMGTTTSSFVCQVLARPPFHSSPSKVSGARPPIAIRVPYVPLLAAFGPNLEPGRRLAICSLRHNLPHPGRNQKTGRISISLLGRDDVDSPSSASSRPWWVGRLAMSIPATWACCPGRSSQRINLPRP